MKAYLEVHRRNIENVKTFLPTFLHGQLLKPKYRLARPIKEHYIHHQGIDHKFGV